MDNDLYNLHDLHRDGLGTDRCGWSWKGKLGLRVNHNLVPLEIQVPLLLTLGLSVRGLQWYRSRYDLHKEA
jgi:hypothetical protein